MQFIEISQYNHETMQLAQPIYDRMRRILLTAGRTIHPTILKRLENMGISTLMVEDAESKGITIDEMLDMPTWMDTIEVIQKTFDLAKRNQPLNIIELQRAVNQNHAGSFPSKNDLFSSFDSRHTGLKAVCPFRECHFTCRTNVQGTKLFSIQSSRPRHRHAIT